MNDIIKEGKIRVDEIDVPVEIFLGGDYKVIKQYQCILDVFGLHQVIENPTRVTKSSKTLIDHLITNFPQRIADTGIIPCSIVSDHDGIYASINARVPRFEARYKYIRDIKRPSP